MNNNDVYQIIVNCKNELNNIKKIINNLKQTSNIIPYLTKYTVIKTCGTIELSFKTLISDFCSKNQNKQIKNYLDKTIRNSSMNPSIDNIFNLLKKFDSSWHFKFKKIIKNHKKSNKIIFSIKSLNETRNLFAHGGNPTITFHSIINYFYDSIVIIYILDNILK